MEAVHAEPEGARYSCFACPDHGPADEAVRPSWSRAVPVADGDTRVIDVWAGKTEQYLRGIPALAQRAGRVNRLRDAIDNANDLRVALDEQKAEDGLLVLYFSGHGRTEPTPAADAVLDNLFMQCKSCRDDLDTTTPDLPECDAQAPRAATPDAEPSASWQTLPQYTARPFVPCSRCGASALTPEAVAAAQARKKAPVPATLGKSRLFHWFVYMQLREAEAVAPLAVTIRDKQLAQDYRQGLRCFVDAVLDVLRRMVVMVLAALSHLTQALPFLLVILGAIRHYGRRGESDGHSLLTLRVQPTTPRGAAFLAA